MKLSSSAKQPAKDVREGVSGIKIKVRSFKSSEHINEKKDGQTEVSATY